MSGSARKRISKWDLKDAPELSLGERPYDDWPGKEGKVVSNKESQPGWQPTEFAGSNDPKWYSVEANNKDGREFSDATMTWDGDGSYSTKMSPGLDDWRQRNRSRSPKSISGRSYSRSRSRSRSRSPARGFRRESGLNDRNTALRPCKDFAAGRCRRGDRCQYLHQDDGDYKDRRYSEGRLRIGRSNNLCNDFYKGKCHRGATCRYAHDSAASDGFGKGSASEVFRERESDRRNKGALFEHSRDHESRRSGDIPCKFFAAGNCRNGKFCRFSHQGQRRASPDDRSRDDWRRPSNNTDNASRESIKWSDKTVSDVAKLQEWSDDRYEDASASGRRATERSMHNRLEHTSNNESRSWGPPNDSGKTLESNERDYLHSKEENTGAGMGVSESRGADIWLPDMDISPTWNCRVQSSNHIVKEELGHIVQTSPSLDVNGISLPTCDQDITREALGQKHHATIQPMISENSCDDRKTNRESAISTTDLNFSANVLPAHSFDQNGAISTIDLNFSADVLPARSFDQNGPSSSAVTEPISSLNAVGQHQQMFLPLVPRGENVINLQNHQLLQEEKSFNKPDVGVPNKSVVTSEVPPNKNIVNREQLSQLTDLSVSLARFFANGQQLPQLCTAVNPQCSVDFVQSSFPDSAEPVIVLAEAYSQQNQAIEQKQYDPVSDSVEMSKPDVNNSVPGYSTNFIENRSVEDGKQGILAKNLFPPSIAGGLSGADLCKTGNSVIDLNHESLQLNKLDPVVNCEGEEKNGTAAGERNKAQDNDPLEKMDGDSKADKGKKNNEAKGIRAFKFALVEFVKDLLKPMWKEGQVSKEAHKTIVKKVVDKVMGSIQGAHIPQSQEKIDNYLSSSKPKLTKLVQAYLEKFQKS